MHTVWCTHNEHMQYVCTVYTPDLDARERVIVNVVFLQNSTTIVIEIDAHLFPTVNAVVSEDGLTTCGDPHSS